MWHAFGVSKARVIVQDRLSAEQARRSVLALLAMGLDAEAEREYVVPAAASAGSSAAVRPVRSALWRVSVAEDELDAALPVLADGDVLTKTAQPGPPPSALLARHEGIWTWQNASGSLFLGAVLAVIHVIVHGGTGPSSHSTMIAAGAVAAWLVDAGQWWRLVTAVFLHFDVKHLVSNMAALFFLGPPLAAAIGQARLITLFVATGAIGNLASQLFGEEAAIKAGASGGVCGLLGALAGVALATMASSDDPRERRPAWQTLGALVALFGMIVGFEPGRDHYAHVGGVIAGVALGRLFGVRSAGNPT